jgi:hypothetical protein
MSNSVLIYKTSEVAQIKVKPDLISKNKKNIQNCFLFLRLLFYLLPLFYININVCMYVCMYVCVHTFIYPVLCVLLFRWVKVLVLVLLVK